MTTKKRDLAQELVDFLLKEDELKKAASGVKKNSEEKAKPHLVSVAPTQTSPVSPVDLATEQIKTEHLKTDQIKTEQLKTEQLKTEQLKPEIFEFTLPDAEKETSAKSLKILDELPPEPKEPVKPVDFVTTAPVPEFKTTAGPTTKGFVSQRANLVFNDVSNLMAGTEAVKVAQSRIKTLEKEKDQLRTEIEQLIISNESLQRRFSELKAQHESLERKHKEKIEIIEDEKSVLRTRLTAKDKELSEIKKENEDLLLRFQTDLRKIRVRERELEHRQEIIRAEMVSVASSKDEEIVELKRQLEKLHFELDGFRTKTAEMNSKLNEFYDRNHRTVKALRLALSVLETGDSDDKPKKKEGT